MISLHNQFRVDLPVDQAWKLLTDLPRVAGCMPGAQLDEVVDGEYRGGMATKIGPISARYRGSASFVEHDEVAHRAVIEARGREEKGNGSARGLVTAALKPDGEAATLVDVTTELTISGRAAQFGRSLLAEVSNNLVDEFVGHLSAMVAAGGTTEAPEPQGAGSTARTAAETAYAAAASTSDSHSGTHLDLASSVLLPLARRHAGSAAVALLFGALGYALGRRRAPAGRSPQAVYFPHPSWHSAAAFPSGPSSA